MASKTAPALPTFVVSARDLVHLDQSELMIPKNSWNATRHGPVGVPLPPDRQRHEECGTGGFNQKVGRKPEESVVSSWLLVVGCWLLVVGCWFPLYFANNWTPKTRS